MVTLRIDPKIVLRTLAISVLVASPATATPLPMVTNVSGGTIGTIGGGPADVGWEFSVNRQLLVTALGFWDPSSVTPLHENHEVGIWDLSGNLLADGTVLTTSPFTGAFRYASVSPVLLDAGQSYRIAAFVAPGEADLFQFGTVTIGANPAITVVRGVSTFAGQGFVFPTAVFGGNGIFGPNFQAEVIPEPATMILVGIGLFGLPLIQRLVASRHRLEIVKHPGSRAGGSPEPRRER
jgi:hypothetical protein